MTLLSTGRTKEQGASIRTTPNEVAKHKNNANVAAKQENDGK